MRSPELLKRIELEFLGGATRDWDPDRVAGLMSEATTRALRGVSFETELNQQEALERLSRPGTLAVVPSLAENSPNVVYECLEARIPFLASAAGGIGELVAAEDRARVLFDPTAEGVAAALERVLVQRDALRPVRPAFDGGEVLQGWADVAAMKPGAVAQLRERPAVDVVVVERGSTEASERCLSALARQSYERLHVIRSTGVSVAAARDEGLRAS